MKIGKTLCTSLDQNQIKMMMNIRPKLPNFMLLATLLIALMACGAKESIQPTWEATPIDDQLSQKPLQVSIPIESMEVEEFGADFGEVEELGPLFRELAGVFANVALGEEGGQQYAIDPVIYFAPELDQIEDWSIVQNVALKHINLTIADAVDYELAGFDFIKDLKIYIDFTLPAEGQMDRQGEGILVASYNREEDVENLGCLGRCLSLNIEDINWREILKSQRTFVIYTELVVESVPLTEMKIGGDLGVSVGLKIGL